MLATDNESKLFSHSGSICLNPVAYKTDKYSTAQHLYFLSDEKIKEGHWVIKNNKLVKYELYRNDLLQGKIIATTNPELKVLNKERQILKDAGKRMREEALGKATEYDPLPKPPDSFIQHYVEEYNKGNIITEVMVEFEEICCGMIANKADCCDKLSYKLKIAPDNTIIIKPVIEDWNGVFEAWKLTNDLSPFRQWLEENYNPPTKKK